MHIRKKSQLSTSSSKFLQKSVTNAKGKDIQEKSREAINKMIGSYDVIERVIDERG